MVEISELDVSAHSVLCVNSLIIIQEQCTNNLLIYNGGELFKSLKGTGSWQVKGSINFMKLYLILFSKSKLTTRISAFYGPTLKIVLQL